MLYMGKRAISNAIKEAEALGVGRVKIKRAEYEGDLFISLYKDVIELDMCLHVEGDTEISTREYKDIELQETLDKTILLIQDYVTKMYDLCDLGLYIEVGMWEDLVPIKINLEYLQDYFYVEDKEDIKLINHTYNKEIVEFKGNYYGNCIVKALRSKKTKLITNIVDIIRD